MTKIIIFILACTNCDLTKITYPFNNHKYVSCGDMGNEIRNNISTYNDNLEIQGWYAKKGYLFVGFRCE